MTPPEYRELYRLLRQYQLEQTPIGGTVYNAIDTVLKPLFPYYYSQITEETHE
jgi:hypothetical protein